MSAVRQDVQPSRAVHSQRNNSPPRIRPNYVADCFAGFRIEVFNEHKGEYEPIGINFTSYKNAMLSLRAIQTGNLPLEGYVTARDDHPELFRGPISPTYFRINWFRLLVAFGCALMLAALLSGCSHVRPLMEYQHVSHASDGIGGAGFDTVSAGIRWRPIDGVTVDLLEGYSPNKLNDRHEVFTGRVQVEF